MISMSQERTPSDIFRELLQNQHSKHTPKRNLPQLGLILSLIYVFERSLRSYAKEKTPQDDYRASKQKTACI